MHIKRFRAASVAEALAEIKSELGADAMILSTKQHRPARSSFGDRAKPVIEVVAAVDRDGRRSSKPAALQPNSDSVHPVDPSWRGLALSKRLLDPLENEIRALRDCFEVDRPGREIARLRSDVSALRDAVDALRMRAADGDPAGAELERGAEKAERTMRRNGFGETLSRDLAAEAGQGRVASGRPARVELSDALARRLDVALTPPQPGREAPIELFVGAPGVGKTTSVAKIALRDPTGYALLSTDGVRSGGAETLRHVAEEAGVPFAAAWSPEQVLTRATRLGRARLLIDTPGSSRRDRDGRAELLRLREKVGQRITVHWVAAATTRIEDLRAELRRFDPLRPDSMILTKADEATSLGHLADLVLDPTTPPLRWLGTGTHIPRDLALPDPTRLSFRMLAGAP